MGYGDDRDLFFKVYLFFVSFDLHINYPRYFIVIKIMIGSCAFQEAPEAPVFKEHLLWNHLKPHILICHLVGTKCTSFDACLLRRCNFS